MKLLILSRLILGTHIRPHPYDHSCHEDPLEKLKHELEESLEAIHREEMNHIKVPSRQTSMPTDLELNQFHKTMIFILKMN